MPATVSKAKGVSKRQKSITAFFGGAKSKGDSSDVEHDRDSDNGMDVDDSATVTRKGPGKAAAPDSSDLPPINQIPDMFSDLVSRVPQIKNVVEHVQGRKLRVATMCSGTESPLLALELIQKSVSEHYGLNLEVEHVFSCEIEPFKQAYIERNFHPPILFRDVCELGDEKATTAYGAKATVPGDVDLLIAGTSCVDYSNLNNEKQDIDGSGESGRTFRGMMSWVKKHRPPIVILENVCSAPWPRVQKYFEKSGYSATYTRVDTKFYYIPHTRTRVYLVAVNEKHSKMPDTWKDWITSKLKRPASSTLDAFLLPSDDPRIHQARQKLVQENYNALDRRTGRTDWGRCESRHQRARLEEALGSKRPLTSWEEGGFCKLPDFAWGDWGVGQVERVWDLIDISLLRSATKGIDPSYKTQVWNLSQNVDRTIGSSKVGICPCLTPSMIPYITNRGGPMVGLEALSMQGLPVDKLLLTRETEDQLADLAGNAMSTTVVGACMLAALVIGKKLLKAGNDSETYEIKAGDDAENSEGLPEDDADGAGRADADREIDILEDHIVGENQLHQKPLDFSSTNAHSLKDLLLGASKSARLCECEGRKDITTRELLRCKDCNTSSCKKCGGRPEHNPEPINVVANPRLSPLTFAKELKSTLPMCLSLKGITEKLLNNMKNGVTHSIPEKRWLPWCSAVLRACKFELRYAETKRQEIWTVVYRSPTAYIELHLHPQQPEWRLYGKPEEDEPANSEIRELLELPIARLTCSNELFNGQWDIALPYTTSIPITIEGVGDLVPSWEARLGLMGDAFKDKTVFSELKISVPNKEKEKLDRDITGVYTLLDKCGTANGALHKKAESDQDASLPPLFFLLDPHRCKEAEDGFVFSTSKRRYEYGESRPIICRLDPKWRQSNRQGAENVNCHLPCRWTPTDSIKFKPSHEQGATVSVPGSSFSISVTNDACRSANALLICGVPLQSQAGPEWPLKAWREVDKVHERSTFQALAWLLEPVRYVDDDFNTWKSVDMSHEFSNCERCAPTAPALEWRRVNKKDVPFENSIQAGEYERRLKRRPSPFVTQLKLDENGIGTVRLGINIPSLIHRALSRLPSEGRTEKPMVSWRLNTDFTPLANLHLPKFVLSSNKLDPEHSQPPSFRIPLRKEQLRSLHWMLGQEAVDAPPFVEEEISEAILAPLGWRAEGRAQRPVHIRGGVLADQVGYGKTAITLGLIDCTSKVVAKEFAKLGRIKGKISVKATLIVVPPHLTKQWDSECRKFAGKRFKTVVLSTATSLNSLNIEQVQDADAVIVASSLFKSSVYLDNLESLAAGTSLPTQDGRYFNDRLRVVLASLETQTDRLQDEGSGAVMKQMRKFRREEADAAAKAEAEAAVIMKRLKGKSYREANARDSTQDKPVKKFSGPTMEVVITKKPRMHTQNEHQNGLRTRPESSTEGEDVEDDSDTPILPKRRPSKNAPLVISDDEEEGSEYEAENDEQLQDSSKKVSQTKAATKAHWKSKPPPSSASSDYEEESAEETPDDDSGVHATTSDDEQRTRKSKSKVVPKARQKLKSTGSQTASSKEESDGDSMDVDEPSSKNNSKKPTKRKAADDKPAAKKQKRREDTDPWKLESSAIKRDWTMMQAPPLEMFHFARVVVDEYTYLDSKAHALVTRLTADRKWVLSGTPPIHDFGALKTISAFLDVHLGVDDDGEGQSAQVKKRRREQTESEKFHSFREVHSLEWHAHRHEIGQAFLDRFVRQNIAEIDEIPWTEKIVEIALPAAERAIYLELEHHLRALDMTIKRGKKTESDREKRLAKSLGESSTAEEALLKRCSHFDLDTSNDNAMKACDVIVQERQKQLDDCKEELLKCIIAGVKREASISRTGEESMFREYVRVSRTEGVGDKDASEMVIGLLDKAGATAGQKSSSNAKNKTKEDADIPTKVKDLMWEHREKTHDIRRLTKELVGRVRSLRYFTVVRDLQKQSETPPVISCPSCKRDNVPISEIAVLSSCGHTGCLECVKACAEKEECVYAVSGACKSAARVLNVVKGDTLGIDESREGRGKHYGMKLEKVVHLIKNKIPQDERVLIFVQFPDLMKKLAEALTAHKVRFLEIKGSATQKSNNLEKYQNDSTERVLLLNVMDESASGANLTSANHAIFLSPLLAPTKQIYEANETQAVGRLVRYGQVKHVYVWRFLTKNTIDEEIYQQRARDKKTL